jgi:dynein assembly factor 1
MMSKEAIRLCVKRQELLDNPELNERLYLHHNGFTQVQNLDDFTKAKILFLESNKLTKIENLQNLKNLESLHLQKNKIGKKK